MDLGWKGLGSFAWHGRQRAPTKDVQKQQRKNQLKKMKTKNKYGARST
jgi:hypothetical protein